MKIAIHSSNGQQNVKKDKTGQGWGGMRLWRVITRLTVTIFE